MHRRFHFSRRATAARLGASLLEKKCEANKKNKLREEGRETRDYASNWHRHDLSAVPDLSIGDDERERQLK